MSDKDFLLRVTTPKGVVKELYYSTVIGVLIEQNDSAKDLPALFDACDRIRSGELVDGAEIKMKGYTFERNK